ncbi:MAG: ABC transporter substrate-binding protein [Clostridia bacterium]|nr:ABC transporter substrate-binding protein [Clostridia bacterium]
MKTNIQRMLCLLLAIVMMFAVVGCGSKKSSTEDFDDEDWDIVDDNGDADDADADADADDADDADDNGDKNNNGSGNNATTKTETKETKKKKAEAVKSADDLSWSQLVSKMPSKLKGSTVTMYSWNPAKHVTGAEKVIANFTKQTGIKVNWKQGSYDNYDTEIAALINSGSSPDIIRYASVNIYRMNLTQDVEAATGYDFKGKIWDSQVTSAYKVNGKTYGVNLKNTFNQQPTVVYYSGATIKRYKLDDPYDLWKSGKWTWNKFLDMCRKFKEETGRSGWMTNDHLDLLRFSGLDFMKFDGKTFKDNSSDPAILKTLQKICGYKDSITCEAMREQDKIENGTYLFTTDNMLCARRTDFHYETLKSDGDLYCVPFPKGFNKTYLVPMHEYEAYGFPKGCKNGPAAYYFLRYYLNRDNYEEKTFFVNKQALETYDYVMKQKRFYKVSSGPMEVTNGDSNVGLDTYIRTTGKADQIKSELDKVKPKFKNAVKAANKTVAKFK